jgi:hypothetical protein
MDSNANSSFLAPSTTQVSSRSGSKQTRGIASAVWDHYRTAYENEDSSQKYCNYCIDPNVMPYGSAVSSNMRKHLKAKHAIIIVVKPSHIQATILEKLQQLYAKAKSSS